MGSAPGTDSRAGVKTICAGFFAETRQIRDMIGVRVRQQNQLHVQLVVLRKTQPFPWNQRRYRTAAATRVVGVPHKIRVNGHSVVIGGELREPVQRFDFVRTPFVIGNFAKGSAVQIQEPAQRSAAPIRRNRHRAVSGSFAH